MKFNRKIPLRINPKIYPAILGLTSLVCIFSIVNEGSGYILNWQLNTMQYIGESVEQVFTPGLHSLKEEEKSLDWTFFVDQAMEFVPVMKYYMDNPVVEVMQDSTTYAMIMEAEANCENYIDENGNLVGETVSVSAADTSDLDITKLLDTDYLLGNYYVVDRTANVEEEIFDAEAFLDMDMTLKEDVDGPQILIYHTHSQEDFVDSVPGDPSTTIVGVGAYLAELLEDTYGIEVLHHDGVYDLIDGKLDRSKAYDQAQGAVVDILEDNPTIEVIIDLHRDGVPEETHLLTMVNGKETAQIMFFNGLSSTLSNGNISYLDNPYIQENLALSFQMQLAANEMYSGFTRRIYLKSYRYNMHLKPKTMLVEAGAQTNTVGEMMNAMEVLAEVLVSVLKPK